MTDKIDAVDEDAVTYISTKTYCHNLGLSTAFRQWRAESHCRFLHGYSVQVRIEFQADELDYRGWVVDFGSLKSLKQELEDTLDHKTMVAEDDPEFDRFVELAQAGVIQLVVVERCGMESLAHMIYVAAKLWLKDNGYADRCWVRRVEVSEHPANSAIVEPVLG